VAGEPDGQPVHGQAFGGKNTSVRTSMLSLGGASAGASGFSNEVWNDSLARPSLALSWTRIRITVCAYTHGGRRPRPCRSRDKRKRDNGSPAAREGAQHRVIPFDSGTSRRWPAILLVREVLRTPLPLRRSLT